MGVMVRRVVENPTKVQTDASRGVSLPASPACLGRARLRRPAAIHRTGFALVITISLMVLLALLAVGLLSLSTVSLRSSQAGSAMAEARANARLALILGVGELQKAMGPDQRVSARSSSINGPDGEPNTVGVWESWRWDPTGDDAPAYDDKGEKFQRWLASTRETSSATDPGYPTGEPSDPVWLVNPETTGRPSADTSSTGPGLRAGRVPVDAGNKRRGAYAWAVMDESQKAPIALPHDESPSETALIARRTASGRANPESVAPPLSPETLGSPRRLVSLDTAVLAAGESSAPEILGRQQSLTGRSIGLLTNVAEGGLRRDLTTLLESDADLASALGGEFVYDAAAAGGPVFGEDDGAPRWDYLRDHYRMHQDVRGTAEGTPSITLDRRDLQPDRRNGGYGFKNSPDTETLLPVITKLQLMFSVVTHYQHIQDRAEFFEKHASPRGNERYGAPHLVYDPAITLWNPYDVAVRLEKLRIRIWDPPVLFGFQKNGQWLRPEFESGEYHGLARFQVQNQYNTEARKYFTLLLRGSDRRGAPGGDLTLQPGEVKVFSPYVEPDWNWDLETRGGYDMRVFFDWDATKDFGNRDNRSQFRSGNPAYGMLGIQSVAGWDPRAGLQTDHLSYGGARPTSTKYEHDKQFPVYGDQGWLGISVRDTFSVFAKAGRTVSLPARDASDFQVDILAGDKVETEDDVLRTYAFNFDDIGNEISKVGEITRTFRIGDLLQTPKDPSPGGKSPFAILTMAAKTTTDPSDISQPWVSGHPVHEGGNQDSGEVGSALDTYDLRFEEVADFNTFPGIEIDPGSNRGFYGASSTAHQGVSSVPMFHIPVIPATSLGDWITANLTPSATLPRVTHALGNSHASPLIPSRKIAEANPIRMPRRAPVRFNRMLDHSYLLNDTLWDRYFFSTAADFDNSFIRRQPREEKLRRFLSGDEQLLNPRLVPIEAGVSADSLARELSGLDDDELSRRMGAVMGIDGAFNVNSDSVDAWRALLASARGAAAMGWGLERFENPDKTPFPRSSLVLSGDADNASDTGAIDIAGQKRWAGFRSLTDEQIQLLAENIVEQVRERARTDGAPSLTIGEFVNRRPGSSDDLHVQQGLLQTAIDRSNINADFRAEDSKEITATPGDRSGAINGESNPEARYGQSAEGAPSFLSQGDLMMALAPVVTVRGDTFRLRAYGESRSSTGEVLASAWCEATVQRLPDYIDPVDPSDALPGELRELNKTFGRRFEITTFRWLSPEEI